MTTILWSPAVMPSVLWALFTGMPDAGYLKQQAESLNVNVPVAWAVAWEETRRNLRPTIRGAHGEWGRYQIRAVRGRCPWAQTLDVRRYVDNVTCGLLYLRRNYERCGGWDCAARLFNGRGPLARAYEQRVLTTIGRWHLRGAV